MDDARYIILPGDIRKDTRLTLAHWKVALVLGAYSRRHGWTDLTQNDVGEMAGISRQTVCEAVGELVEWGWVARRKKDKKNQYVYRFIMDREDDCQPEPTVPNKCRPEPTEHCQPRPTGTVGSVPTFIKEECSTKNNQLTERAGAPATLRAARPSLKVKAGDLSWSEWLDAIETNLGADARRTAAREGVIEVSARWPRPGVPMPSITIIRDTTGAEA